MLKKKIAIQGCIGVTGRKEVFSECTRCYKKYVQTCKDCVDLVKCM